MLYRSDIVCISSIDWDFIWQGHQEIMSVFAANGNRVLFVENTGVRAPNMRDAPRLWKRFVNWKSGYKGIRKISENLFVYSPLVLPFPYSRFALMVNKALMLSVMKRWIRSMEFKTSIVWSFLPTDIALEMVGELNPEVFIYYCIDDFVSSSNGAKRIKSSEDRTVKRADLVFTTSRKLYQKCAAIKANTHLFPFGVSVDGYNRARLEGTDIPDDMRGIKGPIIGYVGGLHKWMDIDLIKSMALSRKDVSFVLIGPEQTNLETLKGVDNIFLLGSKKRDELPRYVKLFDYGIIPYRRTPYTENVYPTKINEYLAMGKPVISTKIPEVVEFDRENGGGLVLFIEKASDIDPILADGQLVEREEMRKKRVDIANANSWSGRIESMCSLIQKTADINKSRTGKEWLGNFRDFYHASRNRIAFVLGAALVSYFLIFYSPLVWILAEPLKITDNPRPCDAIVVFGGGVGESGSPGKSTIERARFASNLYLAGYAKYVILSSGYTAKYNDADNMKLIAMATGVPDSGIILESNSGSNYENVKFAVSILKRNGFSSVILVSSPYNMLRSYFLFRHMAKDIKVYYVPVDSPEFYSRGVPIKLSQIEALLHEYLGILYYKIKGYI